MQLAKNSFYTLLGMALPFVIGIVTVPLYISEIGQERYGALSIAWVLLGYFGQMDFGIGRALTQHIASNGRKRSAETSQVVWSAIIGSTAFGMCGGFIVFAGASYFFAGGFRIDEGLRAELLASVWALAICNPVTALTGVTSGALIGLERFRLVSIGTFASNSGIQLFPLLAAHFLGHDLSTLILSALIARLLGMSVFGIAVWRSLLRKLPISASWKHVRHLASFGVWIMVSSFVGPLMMISDRFMIGSFLGAAAVAAYTIPFQIAYRLQIFPLSIAQVLFPRFAAEDAAKSSRRCGEYTTFIGQIFAPVVIGMICVANPVMSLWLGSHLDSRSIPIAQILCVGIWVNAVAQVPFSYIQARGNSKFTALLHVVELIVYFGLLVGFGVSFGLSGVAAAFSLRCAIDCAALVARAGALDRRVLTALGSQSVLILLALIVGRLGLNWQYLWAGGVFLSAVSLIVLVVQVPDQVRQRLMVLPGSRLVPGLSRRGE